MAHRPMVPQEWTKGRVLGTGKFGDIFLCFDTRELFSFALKEVRKVARQGMQALENELEILSRIQHDRIVQYYGSRHENDVLYIFLEYMPAGSVSDHISQHGQFREEATSRVTRQTLEGLDFLHGKEIVHRNIKAANILMDTHGNLKLADFGISKHMSNVRMLEKANAPVEETAYWMAPEVIRGEDYNGAADLWSLGCTVVEMMTLNPPFKDVYIVTAIYKIGIGEQPQYRLPSGASENIRQFLNIVFQQNSARRTTPKSLLRHPFVRS